MRDEVVDSEVAELSVDFREHQVCTFLVERVEPSNHLHIHTTANLQRNYGPLPTISISIGNTLPSPVKCQLKT